MAVTLHILEAVRAKPTIENALAHEFRYTFRSGAQGDFIEGIRAMIIDRDRQPQWRHAHWEDVSAADIAHMTAPLSADILV